MNNVKFRNKKTGEVVVVKCRQKIKLNNNFGQLPYVAQANKTMLVGMFGLDGHFERVNK